MHDNEFVEIDFDRIETHTQWAVLLVIDDKKEWVPRSLINGAPPAPGDPAGSVEVRTWWAEDHGLI